MALQAERVSNLFLNIGCYFLILGGWNNSANSQTYKYINIQIYFISLYHFHREEGQAGKILSIQILAWRGPPPSPGQVPDGGGGLAGDSQQN